MKKKISIHDIAKELNLSCTTISFVLNGKADEKRISPEVRKKVSNYIQKIGYQPNMIAKSLRTGKTNVIAMLVEDISDPFFSSISRGIETIAYDHKYKIFFASTENDTAKTKALIKVFRERQVDGYITSTVIIDNFSGSYQAVKHLLANGFSHIAFITLDSEQTQMHSRLQGYVKAMEEGPGDPIVQKLPCKLSPQMGVEMVQKFIKKHLKVDAIIFATNYLAISGRKAIRDLGLAIPDDIAVIGFDDNTHFNLFSPSITAVAQPVEDIAQEVVHQLLNALSDKRESKKRRMVMLPVKLIVRKSSVKKERKCPPELPTMKNS